VTAPHRSLNIVNDGSLVLEGGVTHLVNELSFGLIRILWVVLYLPMKFFRNHSDSVMCAAAPKAILKESMKSVLNVATVTFGFGNSAASSRGP
jgi:hypothetical protein